MRLGLGLTVRRRPGAGVSPPANSVAPVISGTPTIGQTLTSTTGTWSGSPTYAYQWKANTVAITGATASTYVLTNVELGDSITCTVTATNGAGSASATSNALSPVAALYIPTVAVAWLRVTAVVKIVSTYPDASPLFQLRRSGAGTDGLGAGSLLTVHTSSDGQNPDWVNCVGTDSAGANPIATTYAAWTTSGGNITWAIRYDQSGAGNNDVQATSGSQPTLSTTATIRGIQGMSTGIDTGGSLATRFMSKAAISTNRQNFTNICVYSVGGGPVNTWGFDSLGAPAAGWDRYQQVYDTTNTYTRYGIGNGFPAGAASPYSGEWDVHSDTSTAAAHKLRSHGVAVSRSAQTALAMTGGSVGKTANTAATQGPAINGAGLDSDAQSDADVIAVEAALMTIFNIPAVSTTPAFITDGDSLSADLNNNVFLGSTHFLATQQLNERVLPYNFGRAGAVVSGPYGQRTTILAKRNAAAAHNTIWFNIGSNNIEALASGSIVGGETAIWSNGTNGIKELCDYYIAQGLRVIMCTIIDRNFTGSATDITQKQTVRANLNILINAYIGTSGYRVADCAADASMTNWNNSTYYSDGVHTKLAANVIRAALVAAAYNSF